MRKDDRIRLQHMLDAVKEALTFIQGRSRDDLRMQPGSDVDVKNRFLYLSRSKSGLAKFGVAYCWESTTREVRNG